MSPRSKIVKSTLREWSVCRPASEAIGIRTRLAPCSSANESTAFRSMWFQPSKTFSTMVSSNHAVRWMRRAFDHASGVLADGADPRRMGHSIGW